MSLCLTFGGTNRCLNMECAAREAYNLPPGPNNPVGIVWMAINRPSVGMHGTPTPDRIGRNESRLYSDVELGCLCAQSVRHEENADRGQIDGSAERGSTALRHRNARVRVSSFDISRGACARRLPLCHADKSRLSVLKRAYADHSLPIRSTTSAAQCALQTILSAILRWRASAVYERERVELPDGDFLDLDWLTSGNGRLSSSHMASKDPLVTLPCEPWQQRCTAPAGMCLPGTIAAAAER